MSNKVPKPKKQKPNNQVTVTGHGLCVVQQQLAQMEAQHQALMALLVAHMRQLPERLIRVPKALMEEDVEAQLKQSATDTMIELALIMKDEPLVKPVTVMPKLAPVEPPK